ncbi:MAG: 23S rRNA (pseudouridine(1915)-N(3))-methyltransferase RlmH [Alphaproteobacteria bacterium]
MRLLIAAVGRARAGPATDLYADYARRLAWPLELREVELRQHLPPPKSKAREAELLLAAVPAGGRVVALDEAGRALDSAGFATLLGRWHDESVSHATFLLGGADGHGDAVRVAADLVLSLGPMTWPHMLARVMLVEQLYRATTILSGHPYHRA